MKVVLAYLAGVLPLVPVRGDVLWFAYFSDEFLEHVRQRMGNSYKVKFALCLYRFFRWIINPAFRHLRKRGVLVFFFIANTEREFESIMKYSIDGFITDAPAEMMKYFERVQDKKSM